MPSGLALFLGYAQTISTFGEQEENIPAAGVSSLVPPLAVLHPLGSPANPLLPSPEPKRASPTAQKAEGEAQRRHGAFASTPGEKGSALFLSFRPDTQTSENETLRLGISEVISWPWLVLHPASVMRPPHFHMSTANSLKGALNNHDNGDHNINNKS